MIFSYQTRLSLNTNQAQILQECACLFNKVERDLYVETTKGVSTTSCKNLFLQRYRITARQFNACRVRLDGRIESYRACQELNAENLKYQIKQVAEQIKKLEKKPSKKSIVHQKKRRKARLETRMIALEKDIEARKVRLCFGGKKLFHAQFHLKENDFQSHKKWKKEWDEKRNSEFFVLGSKDESAGNQTCVARIEEDGTLSLRLRLPKALEEKYGKYLEIDQLRFSYGKEAILASLKNPDGQAISYRFKKDEKGWIVFASTDLKKGEIVSIEHNGAIGLDLNSDHIAYVETDRFGNPIAEQVFPLICYGKSKNQLKAALGDICKAIVAKAKEVKKPIVIEELNFQNKKLELASQNPKYARLLSSFAYGLFFDFLRSRTYKEGIVLHQVNPAFTSVIGQVNYAKRYGLSVHLAAALCIARRHQKFSEAPCSSNRIIPIGKGCHVALELPARNRTRHVWHFWGRVKKKIKTVYATHLRTRKSRSSGPPKTALETSNFR
jgi:IS605 OrfB family transposase